MALSRAQTSAKAQQSFLSALNSTHLLYTSHWKSPSLTILKESEKKTPGYICTKRSVGSILGRESTFIQVSEKSVIYFLCDSAGKPTNQKKEKKKKVTKWLIAYKKLK